jgi:hypothetical protein
VWAASSVTEPRSSQYTEDANGRKPHRQDYFPVDSRLPPDDTGEDDFAFRARPNAAPPQALRPYPYQQRGLDEIRAAFLSGARAVLYVAPTGSGKTVLFTNLVDGTIRNGNPPKAKTCMACGESLRPTPQEQREIEAELRRVEHLRRIEALRGMSYGKALAWAGRDETKLQQVAAARGYRRGWVWHRLQEIASS